MGGDGTVQVANASPTDDVHIGAAAFGGVS
jgi:hypothetical protein